MIQITRRNRCPIRHSQFIKLSLLLMATVCATGGSAEEAKPLPDSTSATSSNPLVAMLKEKAEKLASLELRKFNEIDLLYRHEPKEHFDKQAPPELVSGMWVKMYRNFTRYELRDIYKSNSLLFPYTLEVVYFYDLFATPGHPSSFPDAKALAANETDFKLYTRGYLTRRYSCDENGNPFVSASLGRVPPIGNYFEIGQWPAEPNMAAPNSAPPSLVPLKVVLPMYDPKVHDRGLIPNGSMNFWRSEDHVPFKWSYGRNYKRGEAPCVIKRYGGQTQDGGFATEQTWYHPDAGDPQYTLFGVDVYAGVKPDTSYVMRVAAHNMADTKSNSKVKIGVWYTRANQITARISDAVIVVPPTGASGRLRLYAGVFKTPPRSDIFSLRFAVSLSEEGQFPTTVIWDNWNLSEMSAAD